MERLRRDSKVEGCDVGDTERHEVEADPSPSVKWYVDFEKQVSTDQNNGLYFR